MRGKNVVEVALGLGSEAYEIIWSLSKAEFTQSLLLWHIATDFLYNDDHQKFRAGTLGPYCQISKLLSHYMMYLLFLCPTMLPEGIGNKRYQDTCIEAKAFFHGGKVKQPIQGSFAIDIYVRKFFIQIGTRRKSTFFEGHEIAMQLQSWTSEFRMDHEEQWEIVGKM
ncbi:hypothetical protein PTKIN_Ptkin18bG0078000 [Pterospermum kingtungense]